MNFENYVKNTKMWYEQERNGFIILACGITILIVILFTQYVSIEKLLSSSNVYDNYRISINEEQLKSLNDIALPTLAILLLGLTLAIIGFRLILKTWLNEYLNDILFFKQGTRNTVFSKILMHLSKQISLISSIGYFIIISFLSSTIIYRPFLSFSQLYHVAIPSWHIIGCCGLPGTYPVLTIYFTNQFGILIVPLNLILSSFLSLLIGVNILLLIYKIKKNRNKIKRDDLTFCNIINKRNSTFLSIGAIVGLFVECPACAGSLIFYLIGANLTVAGGITTSTTIVTEIQPFFITTSFILLFIPLLIIRKNLN
jgi:hypothetical protein